MMKFRKNGVILVRCDEDELAEFDAVAAAASLKPQEALRIAMRAMIQAHRRYGCLPRDMEIRQKKLVEPVATSVAAQQEVAV
jgi:antitoxin component of RelBE/YafQ-DinJ toxin-antitoxin module